MIIDDLDIVSVALAPHETDSPLIVDPDAVLTLAVAAKLLQPVAGRNPQILYHCALFNIASLRRAAFSTL
jgi:hypothetical protein